MHQITVFGIECGAGDGAELRFEYCRKRVSVSVFPRGHLPSCAHSRHKTPVEDRLVDLLTHAANTPDDDEYAEIVEDVLHIALNAGSDIFDAIKANPPRSRAARLHSSILSPETLCLRLVTLSGELSLVPIEPEEAYANSESEASQDHESESDSDDDFARRPTSEAWDEEITLTGERAAAWRALTEDEELPLENYPHRIGLAESPSRERKRTREVRNVEFRRDTPEPQARVAREPGLYPTGFSRWASGDHIDKPSAAAKRSNKRAPRVREAVDGPRGVGISQRAAKIGNRFVDAEGYAWIMSPGRGWEEDSMEEERAVPMASGALGPNRIVELSDDDLATSEIIQVRRKGDFPLPGVGLVWGDAKDGNVVVDAEDDAWLIDFGGGWTEGWVDRELKGTVAGDEQGVQRIMKLLGVDSCSCLHHSEALCTDSMSYI